MKKSIKYGIIVAIAVVTVILSLDIKNLDEHNAADTTEEFNAAAYARDIWDNTLPKAIGDAPELISIIKTLAADPESAFNNYGRKLGISKTYYFMAHGKGVIKSVNEENIVIVVKGGTQIRLATDFIFGNAVRDGSGIVDIDDFVNMTDFNNVSIELNNIVKEEIVPQLNEFAQPGIKVDFAGTFAINEEDIDVRNIRIIPVSVKLLNGE
jgi:predicted lipoprotein